MFGASSFALLCFGDLGFRGVWAYKKVRVLARDRSKIVMSALHVAPAWTEPWKQDDPVKRVFW